MEPVQYIPIIVALVISLVGGSLAFWRRSVKAAKSEGKRRAVSQAKLDTIITSVADGRVDLKSVHTELQEVKAITQSNAVSISRLEGKMEALHGASSGDD